MRNIKMTKRNEGNKGGKRSALAIVAFVLGASALGLSTYTVYKDFEGEFEREDYPIYYCSSQSAVVGALTSIGTGFGHIIITQSMSLNLDLNGGGSYYIQGITPDITIDCGDNYAFQISNVKLCNIQNLKINATGISVSDRKIIYVSDSGEEPITIQNVEIFGNSASGYGIVLDRDNVLVTNCYLLETFRGISIGNYENCHVRENILTNITTGFGIHCLGELNLITDNKLFSCFVGIFINDDNNSITGNFIKGLSGDLGGGHAIGINIINGDNNLISSNLVTDYRNSNGIGNGYGCWILSGFENAVVANSFLGNEINLANTGTNTYLSSNNFS
jgi:hypothetical protein